MLITGGRAPVALDLARAFHRAGHRVYVAESRAAHLCRTSRAVTRCETVPAPARDPDGFLAALAALIDRYDVDLLLPTCEEIFWVARGVVEGDGGRALPARCRVAIGDPARLVQVHDKGAFIELASDLGFAVPTTVRLTSAEAVWDWARRAPAPLVLKPAFSRFGTEVRIVDEGARDSLRPERSDLQVSPERPWIGQDFVRGDPVSTYSLAHRGRLLAHAAYPIELTAGRACVHFRAVPHPAVRAWVERFVAGTDFTGQIAFDFIVRDDGAVVPLECNPRSTSGLHLLPSEALVDALLDPEGVVACIEPRPGARASLTIPLVLQGWRGGIGRWMRALAARDVLFDPADPLPALDALRVLLAFQREGRRTGRSATQAMTSDIAWDGGAL